MICPKCNTMLQMSDKHGVEIDYCPSCRGIWLDRGELEKIMERELSFTSKGKRFDDDDDDHDDDHDRHYKQEGDYYKHKKKKGFLADFFDF